MDQMINVCVIIGAVLGVYVFMKRFNELLYLVELGRKAYKSLPPDDLGWPLVGSTLSFSKACSAGYHPNSFIQTLLSGYGRVGMHKTHLYGNPTIIITDPEICRQIYLDDESFQLNYPKSIKILEGNGGCSKLDHKTAHRMIASPMNGYEVLCKYVDFIDQTIAKGLEEWSSMREPIELLDEIRSLLFNVILHIFLGSSTHLDGQTMAELHTSYKELSLVIMSIFPFDLPGFTFHRALKARRKIQNILKCVVEEKRRKMENKEASEVDSQVERFILATDENGRKLYDNSTIVDLLLGLFFAGHNTPAMAAMWALRHISQNPLVFQKAKEEQESILRQRPSSQKGLTFKEIKQMKYLTKFINEVLRRNTIAPTNFRKTTTDVNINGYTIPKGWTVQIWIEAIHMDPHIYSNPHDFDPSRWDNYTAKPGAFIPFGLGSRFCPGSELAKLEMAILLHHFILNYKMEHVNPKCYNTHLPSPKPVNNSLCKIIKLPK